MPRFRADALRSFGITLMVAAGASEEEAGLITDHAVAALLSGERNHGMELGTQYVASIREGIIKPGAPMEIVKETPTTLMVDGGMNFGHYVSHHTMLRLIEKARVHHVAAGSIRYQCHVGRLIDYTAMAAEAGMIALMMCDGAWGPKFVAPTGGRERRLGVNPWSMALPSNEGGTVGFDMTSGAASFMKVMRARDLGEAIPEGWILDKEGKDTTDPNAFWEGGSVMPVGGGQAHKGYVLTFMIEAMADVLSGMEFKEDNSRPWPIVDGCFMALFDVEAFRPLAEFKTDLTSFIGYVKSSAPAAGSPGVFYPGERSYLSARRRAVDGVEIPADVWKSVLEIAYELGVGDSAPVGEPISEDGSTRRSVGERSRERPLGDARGRLGI